MEEWKVEKLTERAINESPWRHRDPEKDGYFLSKEESDKTFEWLSKWGPIYRFLGGE